MSVAEEFRYLQLTGIYETYIVTSHTPMHSFSGSRLVVIPLKHVGEADRFDAG